MDQELTLKQVEIGYNVGTFLNPTRYYSPWVKDAEEARAEADSLIATMPGLCSIGYDFDGDMWFWDRDETKGEWVFNGHFSILMGG